MKKIPVLVLGLVLVFTACNCSSTTVNVNSREGTSATSKKNRREDNRRRQKYFADRSVEVLWYCTSKAVEKSDEDESEKSAKLKATFKSLGSGTIVRSTKNRSFIFTAAHVVHDPKWFANKNNCFAKIKRDKWTDPHGQEIRTKILAMGRLQDFAVLIVDEDLGVQSELETRPFTGEDVWAVGYPGLHLNRNHRALSITKGTLATLFVPYRGSTSRRYHRVTSQVYFGSSGGSVWTEEDKLVGIVVFLHTRLGVPYEGSYYITPVNEVVMHLLQKSLHIKDSYLKDNSYLHPFSG